MRQGRKFWGKDMTGRAPALVALMVLSGASAAGAETAPVILVTPLVYGTHMPGLGDAATKLARLIKERSGGTLQLDLKQPGDGTKPDEILDKVSDGKVDAGVATASFWAAKVAAASLFSGFPFGPDGRTYLDWFDSGNGRTLYQEMYDHAGVKVHVIPCAFGGAEAGGWFAKEIRSKDDLKGLRIRIFGLGARVMSEAGANTVLLPGGKLASAFERKEIDAAELYTPAVDADQGLKEKVKLIYMPGWHQPETVLELIVNKDRWNLLTAEQRGAIDGACKAMLQQTLGESAQLQAQALSEMSAKDGVRVATFPDDVLAALKEAWSKVAKDEGDQDYFFRAVLGDIDKFRAKSANSPAPQPAPAPQGASRLQAQPGPQASP
jgi:TRAP-type mannitol/chloroaromatic compound transport system substrate-binding protein